MTTTFDSELKLINENQNLNKPILEQYYYILSIKKQPKVGRMTGLEPATFSTTN